MSLPTLNFRINTSLEAVKEAGGGFIGKSGIYPITINFISIDQTEKGAFSFNMNVDYNGNTQTIYGPTIQNKDGNENKIGARVLNKLCGIAGLDTGTPLAMDQEEHAVGKDNTVKTFVVATDLSGVECQVQVKEMYNKYKGDIKRRLDPINFFTVDGATADELAAKDAGNDVTIGTQLSKIKESEATGLYRLGKDENGTPVTEAEVQAFIESKKSGKPAAATAQPAKPAKNLFANN